MCVRFRSKTEVLIIRRVRRRKSCTRPRRRAIVYDRLYDVCMNVYELGERK